MVAVGLGCKNSESDHTGYWSKAVHGNPWPEKACGTWSAEIKKAELWMAEHGSGRQLYPLKHEKLGVCPYYRGDTLEEIMCSVLSGPMIMFSKKKKKHP